MRGNLEKNIQVRLSKNFVSRSKIIQLYMVGQRFFILNGRYFFRVLIKKEMVGFKLGEFVYTRKMGSKVIESKLRKKKGSKKKI